MKDVSISGEQTMTVQEVATALGVEPDSLRWHIRQLWPYKMQNGKQTYLSQEEVYTIKQRMKPTSQLAGATTDFEMEKKAIEVMSWLQSKLEEEKRKRVEAESKVAILTHVSKTYTTTEIAKEIGMKSAQELNNLLNKKGIQYKQNGTWIPYSRYANLGYFDIKQEVMDNGQVIYHRRITQMGREFILDLA